MHYPQPISYLLPAEPKPAIHSREEQEEEVFDSDLAKQVTDLLWKNRNNEISARDLAADLHEIYDSACERLDDRKARGE
jgi:hypothetical protein